LWRATLAWQREIRAALAPHDVSHVQFVLLASLWWIEEHDEPPTQVTLARHAGTDQMMTSQVLRKLEQRELLTRVPDPADSRARRLSLTVAGHAVIVAALPAVETVDERWFGQLGRRRTAFTADLATLADGAGNDRA
jgi:DNA-binding MarR family transcriptional regulator